MSKWNRTRSLEIDPNAYRIWYKINMASEISEEKMDNLKNCLQTTGERFFIKLSWIHHAVYQVNSKEAKI